MTLNIQCNFACILCLLLQCGPVCIVFVNFFSSAVLLNIIGVILLLCVTCVAGIVVFAYYVQKGCDPYTNEDVSNSNQVKSG
jgi:ABC-type maltose transport system permease subunit